MRIQHYCFIVFAAIVVISCNQMKPQELVSMVNGAKEPLTLTKKYLDKGLQLSTVFKPAEYSALMQLSGDSDYDKEYSIALKEQEGSLRFDFRIQALDDGYDILKDTLPPELYLERIEYLTGAFSREFSLVVNGDTISPSLFHFERTFNMIPYNNFLLGFDLNREDVNSDVVLIYSGDLFQVGVQEFKFTESVISQKYSIDL